MRTLIVAMLLTMLPSVALAQPQFDDPAALVEYAYVPYETDEFPEDMTELFSPTLTQLWEEMLARAEEMPGIGFDPFINAQDYNITDLVIADPAISGDEATVGVSFVNFGGTQDMRFLLVRTERGWMIDDIEAIGGEYPWVLSELLAADPMLN